MRLVCQSTGQRFPVDEPMWRSPAGALLDLELAPRIDPAVVARRAPSLWRYREALPLRDDSNIVSFGEGFTPLRRFEHGGRHVWLKLDHLFPSGSFKDRGATLLVSKVRELGVRRIVEDSSGNAGAAFALYAAQAGVECEIFAPAHASAGKLVQIRRCGARLHSIPGPRETAAQAALDAAQSAYYASHCWNPFFLHGAKTFAYEVVEQLGWRAPETVVLPAGNGTLLLGCAIGFAELAEAGLISRIPRLVAVQAAACAPLANAAAAQQTAPTDVAPRATLAEGIAVRTPVRGVQCLRAVRDSGGCWITVSEDEILAALQHLHRHGYYAEPTCAVAVAALARLDDLGECVVPLTGHGLKATETIAAL